MYLYDLKTFQKLKDRSSSFSKADKVRIPFFKSCKRIPVDSSTNRKKGIENPLKNLANRKRNQPTAGLTGFENSNEIQKLFEDDMKSEY